jgi:hypothetical protein
MPIKDIEEQRIASREAMKRLRERRKAEAEATKTKFEETLPLDAENLNYNMEPTKEKPLSLEEYLTQHPEADMNEYIAYKIQWSYSHSWKKEKEEQDKLKNRSEREKFGTNQHECLVFRRQLEKGQRSNEFYNHISVCHLCMSYYAKRKSQDLLDLNNVGKADYEEMKGYNEVFGEKKREY